MSAGGVIPPPDERFSEDGYYSTSDGQILFFGHRGTRVVIRTNTDEVVLTISEQDTFARLLFRAMNATEVIDAAEVPF